MPRVLPVLALVALIPIVAGCSNAESVAQDRAGEKPKKGRDEFASDQAKDMGKTIAFDAGRAMGYLRDLCDIGPRISGSEGMAKQQKLLQEHFEKHGGKVTLQRFEAKQVSRKDPVAMANMVVTWNPDKERRVIFCGHYDTRPIADQEPERRKWTQPFVAANDSASVAAWMMELAHHMKEFSPNVGIDFVLFDGEEYIFEPGNDKYFFGSEHFAAEYRKQKQTRYLAGVLLDLFAGKNAKYPVEQNSAFWAGAVVEDIWKTAAEIGVTAFENRRGPTVDDDHIALNKAGIPTVDVLDFEYRHWHRLTDLPDMCSGESMAQVAKVLLAWAQKIK
ncbi:MAG: M28 family peptidase [Gemmataceae bacterium]